ncbi:MAG: hypothetical protein ACREQW_19945 [Candidatus Binatia bacterium]
MQAAGRQEGKTVLAIPPSAELRKELEVALKQRFGKNWCNKYPSLPRIVG